jgi:DNA-binding LytR/AlgR family response regulator
MLKAAVCDDNPVLSEKIAQMTVSCLREDSNIRASVNCYLSAEEMMKAVHDAHFDLILMDIELNGSLTGIELARRINTISPDTRIIFVSSYHKYYLDVYDARHLYFVEKDRLDEVLPRALHKCVEEMSTYSDQTVTLKTRGEIEVVQKQDILFVEKQLRIAEFNLRHGTVIPVYMNFEEVLEKVASHDFVQCHRSYIINLRHVVKLDREDVILSEGHRLPVGVTYRKEFQKRFIESHQSV